MSEARFTPEIVALSSLKPHPRNYNTHPDDELDHIMQSIKTHGFYRNIVIAQDGTILAGHGVSEAAKKLGYTHVPVVRTAYSPDDPHALKLLIGDNEIRHLAEVDDRALTELLKELKDADELLGTGYDEMMLANLVMVSRPASEIEDLEAAAQWVGLPEYQDKGEDLIQVLVNFANEEDRQAFFQFLSMEQPQKTRSTWRQSIWWPKRIVDDKKSLFFTTHEGEKEIDENE